MRDHSDTVTRGNSPLAPRCSIPVFCNSAGACAKQINKQATAFEYSSVHGYLTCKNKDKKKKRITLSRKTVHFRLDCLIK